MKKILLFAFCFFAVFHVNAQKNKFKVSLAAGAGQTFGFKNLRSPGYSAKLMLEKFKAEDLTIGLFVDYITQPAKASVDITQSSGVIQTTTYYPGSISTLTFGVRRFRENGLTFGAGTGIGIFTQYAPTKTYSDGSNYYESYKRGTGGFGVCANVLAGYTKGPLQFLLTGVFVWTPVKTITMEEEKTDPLSVAGTTLTIGYSF